MGSSWVLRTQLLHVWLQVWDFAWQLLYRGTIWNCEETAAQPPFPAEFFLQFLGGCEKQRKSPEFKICNDKQKFEKMNFGGGRERRERR